MHAYTMSVSLYAYVARDDPWLHWLHGGTVELFACNLLI
jgi:hypothetical protein